MQTNPFRNLKKLSIFINGLTAIDTQHLIDEQTPTIDELFKTTTTSSLHYLNPINPILVQEQFARIPDEFFITPTDNDSSIKCGLFTEIGRAWITKDNQLIFWNYESGSQTERFIEFDQTIVNIQLVYPKPDIFIDEIEYILVVAIPSEIYLFAANLSISTNNITTTCIKGTPNGRIFFGGSDGKLYEIDYKSKKGIFSRNCKKITHSKKKLKTILPSFLNFTKDDPMVEIKVDESRGILYTLSEQSVIICYDLGIEFDQCKHVATQSNIAKSATSVIPRGISAFDLDPLKIVHISPISDIESNVVNLVAITTKGVRLYFTTYPYFRRSDSYLERPSILDLIHVRFLPNDYLAKIARDLQLNSPLNPFVQQARRNQFQAHLKAFQGQNPQQEQHQLQQNRMAILTQPQFESSIEVAYADNGILLCSNEIGNFHTLICANRNAVWNNQLSSQLRISYEQILTEDLSNVDITSEIYVIDEVPIEKLIENPVLVDLLMAQQEEEKTKRLENDQQTDIVQPMELKNYGDMINTPTQFMSVVRNSDLTKMSLSVFIRNELASQHLFSPRKFVLLTNSGLVTYTKLRPIDHLSNIISQTNGKTTNQLINFFKTYGVDESCSMCLVLATSFPISDSGQNYLIQKTPTRQPRAVYTNEAPPLSATFRRTFSQFRSPKRNALISPKTKHNFYSRLLPSRKVAEHAKAILFRMSEFFMNQKKQQNFNQNQNQNQNQNKNFNQFGNQNIIEEEVEDGTQKGFEEKEYEGIRGRQMGVNEEEYSRQYGISRGEFSGKRNGILLLLSRLLFPIWNFSIAIEMSVLQVGESEEEKEEQKEPQEDAMDIIQKTEESNYQKAIRVLDGIRKYAMDLILPNQKEYYETQIWCRFTKIQLVELQKPLVNLQQFIKNYLYSGKEPEIAIESSTNKRTSPRKTEQKQRAELEMQSVTDLYFILKRSVDCLSLLEIFVEHGFEFIAIYLPKHIQQILLNITFKDFITSVEGLELAELMIESLFKLYENESKAIDQISSLLGERCATFFSQSDNLKIKAFKLLSQAKKTKLKGERNELIRQSLNIYKSVADKIDVESICWQFAELYHFNDAIDIALSRAKIIDPENKSSSFYGKNTNENSNENITENFNQNLIDNDLEEIYSKRIECYQVVIEIFQNLISFPNIALDQEEINNMIPPNQTTLKHRILLNIPPSKKEVYQEEALRAMMRSQDELFHNYFFQFLLQNSLPNILLNLKSQHLEGFLKRNSRDLLWQYYIRNNKFSNAADILIELAEESSDSEENDFDSTEKPKKKFSLEQRIEYLSLALSNMKNKEQNSGDPEKLQELQDKLDVALIQQGLIEEAKSVLEEEELIQIVPNLDSRLFSISQLYNDFAFPLCLWDSCLAILRCSEYEDPSVYQIIWEKIIQKISESSDQLPQSQPQQIINLVHDKVLNLGRQFYPSKFAFPVPYICFLLESLNFGFRLNSNFDNWVVRLMIEIGVPYSILFNSYLQELYSKINDDRFLIIVFQSLFYIVYSWLDYIQRSFNIEEKNIFANQKVLDKVQEFIQKLQEISKKQKGEEVQIAKYLIQQFQNLK
ncbi:nuclear pore complex protein nup155 [Anaeramoeba ignava]|uniref:Nuclear pore complex protein nup155 n=1 Tax=Anaeramoeba ignava TaxID=1746090 RepID=A0A9Q0LLI2_ANAIG|nr:nuclear pore complex protein nup155 [Anaeramoeba ignava]